VIWDDLQFCECLILIYHFLFVLGGQLGLMVEVFFISWNSLHNTVIFEYLLFILARAFVIIFFELLFESFLMLMIRRT
jgi:hypothetical protein